MRFVLVSTHVDQTTGYSKVVSNLLQQLSALAPAVKTYHFGFQRHSERKNIRKAPDNVVVYDAASNEDPKEEGFGFNKIYDYLDMVNPDIVMIYNDPLIIARFMESMKYKKGETSYKLWLYVDQVYGGIAPPLIEAMNKNADRIFLFTPEWRDVYAAYGGHPQLGLIGHAVDPTTFSKVTLNARYATRRQMGVPMDSVIFFNANRNSQRKRLDLCIMGFVQLLKKKPSETVYLLFATNMSPQSGAYYDLLRIYGTEIKRQGLEDEGYEKRLILVDTAPPNSITDSMINDIYNATDIGINTSDGEGFGLCQLEHLYTGAPQIVTDIGAYRSFMTEEVAVFIPSSDRAYFSAGMPLGLWAATFRPEDVRDAMLKTLNELEERRTAARNAIFDTWDSVCASWISAVKSELK